MTNRDARDAALKAILAMGLGGDLPPEVARALEQQRRRGSHWWVRLWTFVLRTFRLRRGLASNGSPQSVADAHTRALQALAMGAQLPDSDPERASRVAASRAAIARFDDGAESD